MASRLFLFLLLDLEHLCLRIPRASVSPVSHYFWLTRALLFLFISALALLRGLGEKRCSFWIFFLATRGWPLCLGVSRWSLHLERRSAARTSAASDNKRVRGNARGLHFPASSAYSRPPRSQYWPYVRVCLHTHEGTPRKAQ